MAPHFSTPPSSLCRRRQLASYTQERGPWESLWLTYTAGVVRPFSPNIPQFPNLLTPWPTTRLFVVAARWHRSGCFKTEADADETRPGNARTRHPREQRVVTDKSGQLNKQMQPTLPPLPELRPLEPLEPFRDMRRSIDPNGSSSAPEGREDGGVASNS